MIATENLNGKSGVYCAIHRDSLKCYVGSSVGIHGRRLGHLTKAKWESEPSCFHRAIRNLGRGSFDFEVIEFCSREMLAERETFWIKFYQSAGVKGFNTLDAAYISPEIEHSEATRARMRESKANITPVTRQRMSVAQRQKAPASALARSRMSEAQKRRAPITEETRVKLIEARNSRPPITETTREKMRVVAKARRLSEETKRRIGASHLGRTRSNDTRENISNGLRKAFAAKGPMTEETKTKIRNSLAATRAKKLVQSI